MTLKRFLVTFLLPGLIFYVTNQYPFHFDTDPDYSFVIFLRFVAGFLIFMSPDSQHSYGPLACKHRNIY